MIKKLKKLLVVLFAVALVASFAFIPVNACTLDGDYSQFEYEQSENNWVYAADGWSYCDDSPFSCCLTTTAGTSWGYGDPGGTLARAFVYVSGLSRQQAFDHDVTNFEIFCHC